MNISLNGEAPLAIANRFLADRGAQASGTLQVQATVAGSTADPQIRGMFSTVGAQLVDPETNLRLREISVMGTIDRNLVTLRNASGSLGGGVLTKCRNLVGIGLGVLQAVEDANDRQKHVLVDKIVKRFGEDLSGRTFALWGLAFKPNTDDMREAPSRVIVHELSRRGATLKAYDPVAMEEAARVMEGTPRLAFTKNQSEALEGADALVVITEWKEFRNPDFDRIKAALKQPVIFDGRNIYEPALMKLHGIEHHGIGRGAGSAGR